MQHLLKNIRISRVMGQVAPAKASTANYGRAVDNQGFEGCVFIALGTTNQEGGGANSSKAAYIRVQAAAATSGTFYSLTGTTASSTMGDISTSSKLGWTTGNNDRKILVTDIYKPYSTHRHLRPILVGSSTGNYGGVIAIQYGLRRTSTSIWKASTQAGSTRWLSTQIGGQTVAATPSVTTATTA